MTSEPSRAGFTSLVAVLLSVQCRDDTVLRVVLDSFPDGITPRPRHHPSIHSYQLMTLILILFLPLIPARH